MKLTKSLNAYSHLSTGARKRRWNICIKFARLQRMLALWAGIIRIMISKKEWLIVAIICLVTVLIVLSPYLYGYFTTPENKIFTGVTFDHDYSYYSMIQQAREGSLLFQNYYTHEEHRSIFFRPLFLIIGSVFYY